MYTATKLISRTGPSRKVISLEAEMIQIEKKKKKNLIQQENRGYLYCNKKQLEIGSECVGKIFIKPKEVCKQSSKSQSYLI